MNKFFIVLPFLSVVFSGSQNQNKEEYKNATAISSLAIRTSEPEIFPFSSTKMESTKGAQQDRLDRAFVGKTTQELNPYNLHTCLGSMLEDQSGNDKYAMAIFSLNRDSCQNGKNKIVLEKFMHYYEQGKANFVIRDELIVFSDYPRRCYSNVRLKLDHQNQERNYLIEYEDNTKAVLEKIYKIWEIDLNKEKFKEIALPKNLQCYNPDYAEGI
ncbi:hypothetical protein GEO21_11685 [Sphingobacterium faecium]|uniref:hypothetical protein n=1 Tax=Sphingobacterium faecium TaxID=34087 RepID=UPI001292BA10|nr:hypothetical protein [Sphingobacterium faecium]MQP28166.1 hypothetical protein [Sphingobacterium faecium]